MSDRARPILMLALTLSWLGCADEPSRTAAHDTVALGDTPADADSGTDAALDVGTDTAVPADTSPVSDTAVPADTSLVSDTAVPADTSLVSDTAVPADTLSVSDTAIPADTSSASDTEDPTDAVIDVASDTDTSDPADTSSVSDADASAEVADTTSPTRATLTVTLEPSADVVGFQLRVDYDVALLGEPTVLFVGAWQGAVALSYHSDDTGVTVLAAGTMPVAPGPAVTLSFSLAGDGGPLASDFAVTVVGLVAPDLSPAAGTAAAALSLD